MLKTSLFVFFCCYIWLCNGGLIGNDQATPYPSIRSEERRTPKVINDTDYWDGDDYVPNRNERHDQFDWALLKNAVVKENANIILSPFSVKFVLALLYEAAGSETPTKRELQTVVPLLASTPAAIRDTFKPIFNSIKTKPDSYDLKLATTIFCDKFVEPRQRYSALIEEYYNTHISTLDFTQSERTAQTINQWCSNATNGYIKNLVTSGDIDNAVMLIVNAIYFKGVWRRPFDKKDTSVKQFYLTPQRSQPIEFMNLKAKLYYFESSQYGAKFLRLPYKGKRIAMTIILPNAKGGIDELIRQLDSSAIHRAQWLMEELEVDLSLPKFKFDYKSSLKASLSSLGIHEIFSDSASLPLLSRGSGLSQKLKVSDVIQKSGIIVNEEGSTAFAATEVELVNKFGDNIVEFKADHPFIFLIEEEVTGTLLFAGKVVDPHY